MQPGSLRIYARGESGTGGTSAHGSHAGGGSGAGALAGEPAYGGVTPGSGVVSFSIGTGGSGNDTVVTGGTGTITAAHGTSAAGQTQGTGGAAGANTVAFKGGDGAPGQAGSTQNGSGGGGSAGSTGAGGSATTSTGGAAGTGAAGPPSLAGAAGANGAGNSSAGAAGTGPGGGASGGGAAGVGNNAGGPGAPGQVIIIWSLITQTPAGYAALTAAVATSKAVSGAVKGYLSFTGAPLPAGVINQWTGTFAQPSAFGPMPPALQSAVIALTPATSTGIGSGVPSAGNWLFLVAGMTEQAAGSGFTIAATDDIHSFWRPGDVTTSTWAVSAKTGKTRTSVWYTANLARAANDEYIAPNGAMAGMACTVLEVAGLSPWDVVTGIATGYAAAATSLNLALAAPSGPAFILAAACGDSTAATQALAPGSPWHALTTVTATNGTDHTCDAVLTTACLAATSGSVSVNATAGSATDLSGVIIGVQVTAAAPAMVSNPGWAGRSVYEAAFGSGFETPPDEMTWTTLSDSAWTSFAQGYKRAWSFSDNSGVPYALGQLQSSTGTWQLDNADGALSPSNTASPYFPDVQPGTPVRLRVALGTIAGTAYNRWYVLQRNALGWPEQRNKALRNFVPLSTTDIWSVVAGSPPSPYRAEVAQDLKAAGSGWWWPCDDQPLAGGVLPTSLRNAAPGTSTALQIIASPGGVSSQDSYDTGGTDLTSQTGTYGSTCPPPSIATYAVAAQSGWMYGDPQSSPASTAAGGPVTASPGAAAWEQTGLLGSTGSHGWFLAANDTYPDLAAGGVTVEGWCNYGFLGSAAGVVLGAGFVIAAQPACPLSLFELATGSAPLAILQLDNSGHLNLLTYNGGSSTSHSVYTGSDLRCAAFWTFTVLLTSSTWKVLVNAGLTASASGSATISPTAPTWFIANGDLGSSGGSALSAIQHSGNAAVSHLTITPGLLPQWRILSRYYAAITGCGLLPAPSGVAVSAVANQTVGGGNTPDGTEFQGSYGGGGASISPYTFSALAASAAGSYTSGPSARSTVAGIGKTGVSPFIGYAVWAGCTALAPLVRLFTSASAGTETEAASVLGAGDSFVSGFGGGASGGGVCQVASGTGASPPSGPSALGDPLGARIERLLGNAGVTAPMRAIDQEPLAVQAALDTGGQALGSSIQNLITSSGGLLYTGTDGYLRFKMKSHLAGDVTVWNVGMNVAAGMIPYDGTISFSTDPQRVFNSVEIQQYSPDGATLPLITPSSATAVAASQQQYGTKPSPVSTSYLVSQAEILAYANWILANYGAPSRRVDNLVIDAATHPAAWPMVLAANPTDLVMVTDSPFGQPATAGIYRISSASRAISFGANGNAVQAKLTLKLDSLPASYWS